MLKAPWVGVEYRWVLVGRWLVISLVTRDGNHSHGHQSVFIVSTTTTTTSAVVKPLSFLPYFRISLRSHSFPYHFFLFLFSFLKKNKMPSHIMRGVHKFAKRLTADVLEKRQNPSGTSTFSVFAFKDKLNLPKLQLAPIFTFLRLWVKSSIHWILYPLLGMPLAFLFQPLISTCTPPMQLFLVSMFGRA